MRYIPVHTNIVVELVEKEKTGIVSAEEDTIVKGRVTEIGEGLRVDGKSTPMLVRPDSLVWFFKEDATKLPETIRENMYVLSQDDILVIEEDGTH